MAIPRLRVDSAVTDVGVHDGAYDVPLWDVGHHADSRNPGEPGNSVFNGHLETLHAGKVFARLAELTPGDAIYVYTPGYLLAWRVETVASVPNDDTGFVQPTADRRITLYTCTGRWDPLAHDYTERFVVVARLVIVSPRA
ncbi:MAG TPA: class F sortase [Chloroflexota bacterium]|jgi:LPXTG-site transpeptidase (sortase) family protein